MLKLLRKIFSKLNYLFYVGSTDILPEPLEKEEEEKNSKNRSDEEEESKE